MAASDTTSMVPRVVIGERRSTYTIRYTGPVEAGKIIQAVRRRGGLSQAELARRAGTSQPVISAYEHGRRDPTLGTLRKLVEAGGERLQMDAVAPGSDLPRPADAQEHARRLLEVLTLADAIPARRRSPVLTAPRLVSI